jgi:aerobic-type carbon monoxide dehydrogenase small subunit (CoxS/CutS family)
MAAKALLDSDNDPDVATIRDALAGNLCRCTGYTKMIEAVQVAARQLKGEPSHRLTHAESKVTAS